MSLKISPKFASAAGSEALKPQNAAGIPSAHAAITKGAQLQNISPQLPECRAVSQRTAGLWTCISRVKDLLSGGWTYRFKLNAACDDITEHPDREARYHQGVREMKKIFPALQKMGFQILYLDPNNRQKFIDSNVRFLMRENYPELPEGSEEYKKLANEFLTSRILPYVNRKCKHAEVLQGLGFRCTSTEEGVYLELPDRKTFLNRWEQLRKIRPDLPPFNIISGEGSLDSKDFVLHFLQGLVLDTCEEAVHDSLAHLIPQIILMLDSGTFVHEGKAVTYEMLQKQTRAYIQKFNEEILAQTAETLSWPEAIQSEDYEDKVINYLIMEMLLSAVVDNLTSFDSYQEIYAVLKRPIEGVFVELMNQPLWKAYFGARFQAHHLKKALEIFQACC